MVKNTLLFAIAILFILITACKHRIKTDTLYGNWKYIKIDKPRGDDQADTVTTAELEEQKPEISFSTKNQLVIYWGGKILSQGTFAVDGDNINYTEQLPGGKSRTFPFWVSKLDDKTIVFETVDKDGSRVTAIKK